MNEVTLEKMKQMKMFGMYDAFKSAIENGKTDHYSSDEMIGFLIEHEYDDRQNRKIKRSITNAKFRYMASIEEISYEEERGLSKNIVTRLAEGNYIRGGESILITGSTGVGKSYLASALGHQACMMGFKVLYFNTNKLLAKIKMAKADGSILKEMARIERQHLIILDDFGLQSIDNEAGLILMDIIEDRHQRGSMIVTSQLPVGNWHEIIKEKTVADAIMDRLVHNAHRVDIKGDSMRKKKQKLNV